MLFFLGNADRVSNYAFLAQALAARGIGLLAISYRGYPGSTGSPSEDGLLTDGIAAFDWLSRRSEGGIVVLGQSLGSGVASTRPGKGRQSVLFLCCLPVGAVARPDALPLPSGCTFPQDSFRSDLKIPKVRQPKLFIHGRHDDLIPLSSSEALYRIAPEPKQTLIHDGAGISAFPFPWLRLSRCLNRARA